MKNVPNFYDNTPTTPLAVVHKGKATLLYCGFDLTPDTPAVRQLKNSLGCFLSGKVYFRSKAHGTPHYEYGETDVRITR